MALSSGVPIDPPGVSTSAPPSISAAGHIDIVAARCPVHHRLLRLPVSTGVMALALAFALAVTAAGLFAPAVEQAVGQRLQHIDFNEVVLHGMLAFLVFAGALHVELNDLASARPSSRSWRRQASSLPR